MGFETYQHNGRTYIRADRKTFRKRLKEAKDKGMVLVQIGNGYEFQTTSYDDRLYDGWKDLNPPISWADEYSDRIQKLKDYNRKVKCI